MLLKAKSSLSKSSMLFLCNWSEEEETLGLFKCVHGPIWRESGRFEGERASGGAACPLGAVTSQALHSFTLQGQIPVTEPGRQIPNAACCPKLNPKPNPLPVQKP